MRGGIVRLSSIRGLTRVPANSHSASMLDETERETERERERERELSLSVLHRQGSEIAGRAKLRPNRLGTVKMPCDNAQ